MNELYDFRLKHGLITGLNNDGRFLRRYIHHPEGQKVTNAWLSEGSYEIEVLGTKYSANIHLKSPFDPKNLRIQGLYNN